MSFVYVGCHNRVRHIPVFNNPTIHPRDLVKLDYDAFTNNVDLVSKYEPHEVVVVHECGNINLLSNHPDFPKWEKEINSGEFWSLVGESWLGTEVGQVNVVSISNNETCVFGVLGIPEKVGNCYVPTIYYFSPEEGKWNKVLSMGIIMPVTDLVMDLISRGDAWESFKQLSLSFTALNQLREKGLITDYPNWGKKA